MVPRDAPVIGLSLDTAWHARMGITTQWYEVGVTRAGGKTIELRPGGAEPEEILNQIDALVLAGGGDIDPKLYGGEADDAQLVDRQRDAFELALIRGALQREMPILGVCRGIQILNVWAGGTVRNLRDHPKLADVHGIGISSMSAHAVDVEPGSKLAGLLGAGPHQVNSFHSQAVGEVGQGFRVSARAPDGVVEGIELVGRPFVVGMQFHPEIVPQEMAVFETLLEEARTYQKSRRR